MELTAIDVILNGIRNTLPDDTKIDKEEEKVLEGKDENKYGKEGLWSLGWKTRRNKRR